MVVLVVAIIVVVAANALLIALLVRMQNRHGSFTYRGLPDDGDTQPDMWWYTTRRERPDGTILDFPEYREDR